VTDWNSVQIPPPSDWQAFERLCQRLWIRLWSDPNAQLNGRTGQEQHGVDIFGQIQGTLGWGGIQCKRRDGRFGTPLAEGDLRDAVNAALTFEPPLDEFILATTTNSDAAIQALARKLTQAHRAKGLFGVHVLSWPELVTRMAEHYPELIEELLCMPASSPGAARAQLQQIRHELESCVEVAAELKQRWPAPARTLPVRIWPAVGPELHRAAWLKDNEYRVLAAFFEACAQINQAFESAARVNVYEDRRAGPVVMQPKWLLDEFFRTSVGASSGVATARAAVDRALEHLS
jgi:hypothetical protein